MEAEPDHEQQKAENPAAQQDLGDNFEPFGVLSGHGGGSLMAGQPPTGQNMDLRTSSSRALILAYSGFMVTIPKSPSGW